MSTASPITRIDICKTLRHSLAESRDCLIAQLELTPEERLGWSPSPTARTPLELVGHVGHSMLDILKMLRNEWPAGEFDAAAFDAHLRSIELGFKSKREVIDLLRRNTELYLTYLAGLTEEELEAGVDFNGTLVPRLELINFGLLHTRDHTAQLEYLQTIWGDRSWH